MSYDKHYLAMHLVYGNHYSATYVSHLLYSKMLFPDDPRDQRFMKDLRADSCTEYVDHSLRHPVLPCSLHGSPQR